MTAKVYRVIPWLLGMALCLSGCAGVVGGDLRNTKSYYQMPSSEDNTVCYHVIYKSDAKDDYASQNIAGLISSFTCGIVPTYWKTTVHSQATILHDGSPVYTGKYVSRVHKFYGVLWTFVLPLTCKSINALQADEGVGIEIKSGIRDRTLWKVADDYGLKEGQFYLVHEDSTNTPPNPMPLSQH